MTFRNYLSKRFGKANFKIRFLRKNEMLSMFITLIVAFIYCSLAGADMVFFLGREDGERRMAISSLIPLLLQILTSMLANNVELKKVMFKKYLKFDIIETLLYELITLGVVVILFDVTDFEQTCKIWFRYSIVCRVLRSVVSVFFPRIQGVFVDSLFSDQLERQNHYNNSEIFYCIGALAGLGLGLYLGNWFRDHVILILLCYILADCLSLYSNYKFFYNKENFNIIKHNFARSCAKWWNDQRKQKK